VRGKRGGALTRGVNDVQKPAMLPLLTGLIQEMLLRGGERGGPVQRTTPCVPRARKMVGEKVKKGPEE